MPFGSNFNHNDGKTQTDIIEAYSTKQDLVECNLELPGLQWILDMSEVELIDFFTMVLKSRANIREINFSLGDYKSRETQSRAPGSKNIHEKSFKEAARVIVLALQQDPKVVGVRIQITKVGEEYVSLMHVKVADKEPQGPQRIKGKLIKGDDEYKPKLINCHTSAI